MGAGEPEWNIAETFAFVRASGSFGAARVEFRTTRCVNKWRRLRRFCYFIRICITTIYSTSKTCTDSKLYMSLETCSDKLASKRRWCWTVYCGARCASDDDGCSSNGQQARDRSRKSEPVLGRGARQPRHRDADTRPAAYRGGRSACSRPGLPTFPSLVHWRKSPLLRRRSIRHRRRTSSRFTTLPTTSLPIRQATVIVTTRDT